MSKLVRIGLILLAVGLIVIGISLAMGASYAQLGNSVRWMNLGETIGGSFQVARESAIEEGRLEPIEERYSLEAQGVTGLDIEWFSGSIQVLRGEQPTIEIHEIGQVENLQRDRLVTSLEGGVLKVSFNASRNFINLATKNLTITIPESLDLRSLKIDCLDTQALIDAGNIPDLSLSTMSGTFTVEGEMRRIKLEGMDGSLHFSGRVQHLEANTMDGNIFLTLPSDHGFTLRVDAMEARVTSDFSLQQSGDTYTYGNGEAEFFFNTMSGSIEIRGRNQ